jgi:fibronectin-binding autotransporter adhesin
MLRESWRVRGFRMQSLLGSPIAGCRTRCRAGHWLAAIGMALLIAGIGAPAQAVLIRVDFQPDSTGWGWNQVPVANGTVESYASAADPVFGSSGSNVWDTRSAAGYPNWGSNPTYSNLLDSSTGTNSGVSVSFTGSISGAGGTATIPGDNLRRDYLVLLGSHSPTSADYTISGLLPNAPVKLFLYDGYLSGADPGLRGFNFTITGDPTTYNVIAAGLFVSGTTDGSGRLTGTWSVPGGQAEADFAGFQLYQAPPAARNSVATGSWSAAGTWDSGVPDSTLGAIINNTHTVIIDAAGAASYFTVNSGGKLALASGQTLTLGGLATVNSGGEIAFSADSKLVAGGGTIDKLTATGNFTLDLAGATGIATYNDGGNTLTLTKQGAGTLTLPAFASNTATGTTFNVAGGVLSASAMDLGGGGLAFGGGTFQYTGASVANSRTFLLDTGDAKFDVAAAGTELTLNGAISGSGGLSKSGAGTLTLANVANSYSGATIINAGVLSIASVADGGSPSPIGAATGNAANLMLNGGTLRYTGPTAGTNRGLTINPGVTGTIDVPTADSTLTLSGAVPSTSGRLVKTGSGTLNLDTPLTTTYDGGAVSIQAGTLSVGASGSITATAGQGRILVCDAGGQNATLTVDGGTITANRLFMDYGIPAANPTFNLQSGAVTLTNEFVGAYTSSGTATTTINISGGTLTSNAFFTIGASCGGTNIATVNQTGGLVSATSTSGSYGLQFSSTGGAVTATYNLDGGVLLTSGVTNPGHVTAANQTFNFGGGTLCAANNNADFMTAAWIGNVNIKNGGATIDTQSFAITIANPLKDFAGNSGGLTKLGTGTLTLSGVNTYTGTTTVGAGTLQAARPAALYNDTGDMTQWTAARIVVNSGGTLAVNYGGSGNDLNETQAVAVLGNLSSSLNNNGLQAGSAFGFDTTNATSGASYGNLIADSTGTGGGAVGIAKLGTNMLTLGGANTYTGATSINGGMLSVGILADAGSSSPIGAASSDPSNLVLNGGGLQYTGPTVSTNRGLTIGPGVTATLDVSAADTTLTLRGAVPETSGRLVKAGAGTLKLETPVTTTYASNAVTIQAGALTVGASGSITANGGAALGTGVIYVCDAGAQNATLTVDGGTIAANRLWMDYSMPASNPTLNLNSGTVTLANEFVGGFPNSGTATTTINVSGGTLTSDTFFTIGASCGGTNIATVNQTGGLVSATQNTGGNKGLQFSSTGGAVTATYNLDGGVLLTSGVTNPGNVTAANQTFNFGGGTLRAANDNADFLSAGKIGNVQIKSGGAVVDTQDYAVTIANPLRDFPGNSGGLTKVGGGTLVLSGANTYSGATTISQGVLKLQGPPTVSYVGTQFDMGGPGQTGFGGAVSHWRQATTAKTCDIDADNVLGTDGYSVVHVALGSEIASTPSYLATAGTWTGPVFGAGSGFGYVMMDDPTNPDSAIQCNTIYPGGNGTQLYTFALPSTGTIPAKIRMGVMIDGLDAIAPNPSAIWLTQLGGSLASSATVDTAIAGYNNRQPDWVFFDIVGATAGMQFAVCGNQGVDAAGQTSHQITVQAVSFDSLSGAAAARDSNVLADTSPVSIAAGAMLDLSDSNETIGPLSGAGDVWLGAGTLTVNAVSTPAEPFSGSIVGTGGLVKSGDATLELSGANDYSGGTRVTDGTLVISGAGALPAGMALTIGSTEALSTAGASAATVPEPGTIILLATALAALAGAGCKRRK